MAIIFPKQAEKNSLPDLLFLCLALTLILFILVPPHASLYSPPYSAARAQEGSPSDLLTAGRVSFAADQQYWAANCSSGWSANARCASIVARTRSCAISVNSPYCSAYEKYLQVDPYR